jgi:hypothetical protein
MMTVEFKSSVEEFSDGGLEPVSSSEESHSLEDLVPPLPADAAKPNPNKNNKHSETTNKKQRRRRKLLRKLPFFFSKYGKKGQDQLQLHDSSTAMDSTGQSSLWNDSSLRSSIRTNTNTRGCLKHRTQAESERYYYGKQSPKKDAHVQWGDLTISSHAYALGDNPSCPGPAVSSSYKAFDHVTVPVDDYEATRPVHRAKHQLVMPMAVREDLLKEAGYARSYLKEAAKQGEAIRKSREFNSRKSLLEKLTNALHQRRELDLQRARLSDSIGWAHNHIEGSSRHSAATL